MSSFSPAGWFTLVNKNSSINQVSRGSLFATSWLGFLYDDCADWTEVIGVPFQKLAMHNSSGAYHRCRFSFTRQRERNKSEKGSHLFTGFVQSGRLFFHDVVPREREWLTLFLPCHQKPAGLFRLAMTTRSNSFPLHSIFISSKSFSLYDTQPPFPTMDCVDYQLDCSGNACPDTPLTVSSTR